MITRLSVRNFGPHADTSLDFDPDGVSWISGESMVGKSTLIDAVCYLFWQINHRGEALPLEQIHIGAEKAALSLTTKMGSTLTRTITARRSETRQIERAGIIETYPTNAACLAALKKVGENTTIGRLIVAPMAWVALLEEGKGRPLRDALARVLPGGDVRATVAAALQAAGVALVADDPLDELWALRRQTEGNSARDRAAGAAEQARIALASQPPAILPPSAEEVTQARALLAAGETWRAHRLASLAGASLAGVIEELERVVATSAPRIPDAGDAERVIATGKAWERYDQTFTRYQQQVAKRTEVRARRAKLGESPQVDLTELRVKQTQRNRQRMALDASTVRLRHAEYVHSAAVDAADRLSSQGDTCPTCLQHWAAKNDKRFAAVCQRDAAFLEVQGVKETVEGDQTEFDVLQQQIEQLEADVKAAAALEQRNRDIGPEPEVDREPTAPEMSPPTGPEIADAKKRLADVAAATSAQLAHEQRVATTTRDLEARRRELAAAIPEAPSVPQPTADELVVAAGVLRDADIAERQGKAAQRDRERLERQVTDTERAHAAAVTEAERRRVLVAAVRQAPSQIARSRASALGDLGPVQIVFPASGDAIEVRIDGAPWWLASTGRQVLADLHLRAAIRRVANLPSLPIIVDRVQDWTGTWPAIPGPVWFLESAPGALQVVRQ